jgi:hypothetical protein
VLLSWECAKPEKSYRQLSSWPAPRAGLFILTKSQKNIKITLITDLKI